MLNFGYYILLTHSYFIQFLTMVFFHEKDIFLQDRK